MTPTKRSFTHAARIVVLVLALLVGGASLVGFVYMGSSDIATARQQPTVVPTQPVVYAPATAETSMDITPTGLDTDPFIRTELFFGSERPNKPEVSAAEFKQFLDEEVTPRFPDGLTLLTGFGQFREANGETVQETSFVLLLLYPKEMAKDSSAKIEEIRTQYITRFEQESVLRVDDPRPVRVSF